MKIAICVPCRDTVMSGFCFDLAKMIGYHSRNTKDEILIFQMPGTLIFHQREKLAEEALKAGERLSCGLTQICGFRQTR